MDDIQHISLLFQGDKSEIKSGLDKLLSRWHARAIGIWSFHDQALHLLNFSSVSDMPEEISIGFQQATLIVTLAQDKLGIVNTVIKQAPVPAYIDPNLSPLRDSASWIEKFGCKSSLSAPVFHVGKITKVLAVSYINMIQPTDHAWQEQLLLASMLS